MLKRTRDLKLAVGATLTAAVLAALLTATPGLLAQAPRQAQVTGDPGIHVVDTLSCAAAAAGELVADQGSSPIDPIPQTEVGSPCCQTLCAQICGEGTPCLCKRCQLFACGV